MIKKANLQKTEARKNMRGAPGEVKIRHYFGGGELNFPCRLCAELTIPPGAGIGLHEHIGEDEIFIVQRGSGVVTDSGRESAVAPGDAIVTGKGGSHAVMNTGAEDLVMTAIIVVYGKQTT
ncbi:MAG TPA: cupin domain-containing protein [bacterium]|nr:cupin domain-containing protein [bacterium]